MGVEKNLNIETTEIIGNDPEKALASLEKREKIVLAEAEEFGIGEIQCTEFTHRQEKNVCDFISNSFPNLEELVLSE